MDRGFALGLGLGVALGVAGAWLLRPSAAPEPAEARGGSAESPVSPPTPAGLASDPEAGLRKQLADTNAALERVTRELEAAQKAPPPAAAEKPRVSEEELPPAVRKKAARLAVSDAVLDLMWRARNRYYGADAATREELVAPLRPFGEEAVRAAAAVLMGGAGHIDIPMIVRDLHLRDGAEVVLRVIEEDKSVTLLAQALPAYDSPAVRTYLLDRIARESDVAAYWNLSTALGDLKESRGPEVMRIQQFSGPTFVGVRGSILYDVGRMGGPAAVRLLDEYLQIPSADQLGSALRALATLDRDRAVRHARRIKESDRYGFLDYMGRIEVENLTR